ncbi:hypothetical protein NT6N_19280 [Oceaniferula spumae]|uniref:RNA polymerase sigma-70 region 2 domain-containing protein n=1 Tax=Oceaniferula spumae TaxID=2979115 RepID=A0AAT9FLS1_9BACT
MENPHQILAVPSPEDVAKWLLEKQSHIIAYARVIVQDMQLAEDIFQDVCVRAVKMSAEFDSAEGTVRWAMKAARNKAIDYLRKTRREVAMFSPELLDRLSDEWMGVTYHAQQDDGQQAVYKNLEYCLAKLTKRTRALLDMRYGDGRKPNEIAAMVDQKVTAVYKTLTRANSTLKSCMENRT